MHKKNTLETLFKNNMLKLAVIRKVAGFVEARFGKKELIDILTDKDVNKNIENSMKVLLIKGNLNELSNLIETLKKSGVKVEVILNWLKNVSKGVINYLIDNYDENQLKKVLCLLGADRLSEKDSFIILKDSEV